ncbi:MAG: 2-hydroxychromene-2-carboxylate isomerase [Alphaproteobacteria bacterium]|nr:2-hydroxychromene-2-carboxylate isomerase [Alphaproteobacteria bacterium]MCB9928058.1 2-hydroxychromene-2-carboxylate isomerase [Alphaproteobacteria bacterium]
MPTLEFFFDVSSPWTYLAFERIEGVAARTGAELVWKPFLVGGVFNKVNPSVYQRRENPVPVKDAHYRKSMEDWAAYQGLTLIRPSVFPLNSVKALRGAFVAIDQGKIVDYARACFEAYWRDDKDISKEDELRAVVTKAGMDPDDFFAKIATDEIKQRLFNTTDELIERGGYGSPTLFVNGDDMYFGNDQMELVEWALKGKKTAA